MTLLADIWSVLDRCERRQFALLHASALTMSVSTLVGIAAVAPFFAVLGDPGSINRSIVLSRIYGYSGVHSAQQFLVALGISFLALVLLSNAINLAGSVAMNRFAHLVGNRLSVTLFDEYIRRSHSFHLASNSATLFDNVIWEVNRGITGVLQSLFILATNLVTGALIVASIAVVNPLIALSTGAALAGSYGLIYLITRRRLFDNGMLESKYTDQRTKTVNESLGAIREIIASGSQGYYRDKFAQSCHALSRAALNTYAIAQSPRYIMECIVVAGLVTVTLILAGRGIQGEFWLARLSFLGFAAYRLLPALQQIFHAIVRIRGDRVALVRILSDLRSAMRRKTQPLPPAASQDAPWCGRPRQEILVSQVSFSYGTDRPMAIRDVSMRITAGQTVGLIGVSGSGKTTLTELILGLLAPTSGTIAVDGEILTQDNRAQWRATIGYVPQHPFLFDASLAENVALATAPEDIDVARLKEAVNLAQLDDLVATFQNGFSEIVGERGAKLSGGQRQRVGIARALYRRTSVLILDEATNALDGLTESEILATLENLRGRRTIILIAHRLSTVRPCDIIYELDGGNIIKGGTFSDLTRPSPRLRSRQSAASQSADIP